MDWANLERIAHQEVRQSTRKALQPFNLNISTPSYERTNRQSDVGMDQTIRQVSNETNATILDEVASMRKSYYGVNSRLTELHDSLSRHSDLTFELKKGKDMTELRCDEFDRFIKTLNANQQVIMKENEQMQYNVQKILAGQDQVQITLQTVKEGNVSKETFNKVMDTSASEIRTLRESVYGLTKTSERSSIQIENLLLAIMDIGSLENVTEQDHLSLLRSLAAEGFAHQVRRILSESLQSGIDLSLQKHLKSMHASMNQSIVMMLKEYRERQNAALMPDLEKVHALVDEFTKMREEFLNLQVNFTSLKAHVEVDRMRAPPSLPPVAEIIRVDETVRSDLDDTRKEVTDLLEQLEKMQGQLNMQNETLLAATQSQELLRQTVQENRQYFLSEHDKAQSRTEVQIRDAQDKLGDLIGRSIAPLDRKLKDVSDRTVSFAMDLSRIKDESEKQLRDIQQQLLNQDSAIREDMKNSLHANQLDHEEIRREVIRTIRSSEISSIQDETLNKTDQRLQALHSEQQITLEKIKGLATEIDACHTKILSEREDTRQLLNQRDIDISQRLQERIVHWENCQKDWQFLQEAKQEEASKQVVALSNDLKEIRPQENIERLKEEMALLQERLQGIRAKQDALDIGLRKENDALRTDVARQLSQAQEKVQGLQQHVDSKNNAVEAFLRNHQEKAHEDKEKLQESFGQLSLKHRTQELDLTAAVERMGRMEQKLTSVEQSLQQTVEAKCAVLDGKLSSSLQVVQTEQTKHEKDTTSKIVTLRRDLEDLQSTLESMHNDLQQKITAQGEHQSKHLQATESTLTTKVQDVHQLLQRTRQENEDNLNAIAVQEEQFSRVLEQQAGDLKSLLEQHTRVKDLHDTEITSTKTLLRAEQHKHQKQMQETIDELRFDLSQTSNRVIILEHTTYLPNTSSVQSSNVEVASSTAAPATPGQRSSSPSGNRPLYRPASHTTPEKSFSSPGGSSGNHVDVAIVKRECLEALLPLLQQKVDTTEVKQWKTQTEQTANEIETLRTLCQRIQTELTQSTSGAQRSLEQHQQDLIAVRNSVEAVKELTSQSQRTQQDELRRESTKVESQVKELKEAIAEESHQRSKWSQEHGTVDTATEAKSLVARHHAEDVSMLRNEWEAKWSSLSETMDKATQDLRSGVETDKASSKKALESLQQQLQILQDEVIQHDTKQDDFQRALDKLVAGYEALHTIVTAAQVKPSATEAISLSNKAADVVSTAPPTRSVVSTVSESKENPTRESSQVKTTAKASSSPVKPASVDSTAKSSSIALDTSTTTLQSTPQQQPPSAASSVVTSPQSSPNSTSHSRSKTNHLRSLCADSRSNPVSASDLNEALMAEEKNAIVSAPNAAEKPTEKPAEKQAKGHVDHSASVNPSAPATISSGSNSQQKPEVKGGPSLAKGSSSTTTSPLKPVVVLAPVHVPTPPSHHGMPSSSTAANAASSSMSSSYHTPMKSSPNTKDSIGEMSSSSLLLQPMGGRTLKLSNMGPVSAGTPQGSVTQGTTVPTSNTTAAMQKSPTKPLLTPLNSAAPQQPFDLGSKGAGANGGQISSMHPSPPAANKTAASHVSPRIRMQTPVKARPSSGDISTHPNGGEDSPADSPMGTAASESTDGSPAGDQKSVASSSASGSPVTPRQQQPNQASRAEDSHTAGPSIRDIPVARETVKAEDMPRSQLKEAAVVATTEVSAGNNKAPSQISRGSDSKSGHDDKREVMASFASKTPLPTATTKATEPVLQTPVHHRMAFAAADAAFSADSSHQDDDNSSFASSSQVSPATRLSHQQSVSSHSSPQKPVATPAGAGSSSSALLALDANLFSSFDKSSVMDEDEEEAEVSAGSHAFSAASTPAKPKVSSSAASGHHVGSASKGEKVSEESTHSPFAKQKVQSGQQQMLAEMMTPNKADMHNSFDDDADSDVDEGDFVSDSDVNSSGVRDDEDEDSESESASEKEDRDADDSESEGSEPSPPRKQQFPPKSNSRAVEALLDVSDLREDESDLVDSVLAQVTRRDEDEDDVALPPVSRSSAGKTTIEIPTTQAQSQSGPSSSLTSPKKSPTSKPAPELAAAAVVAASKSSPKGSGSGAGFGSATSSFTPSKGAGYKPSTPLSPGARNALAVTANSNATANTSSAGPSVVVSGSLLGRSAGGASAFSSKKKK